MGTTKSEIRVFEGMRKLKRPPLPQTMAAAAFLDALPEEDLETLLEARRKRKLIPASAGPYRGFGGLCPWSVLAVKAGASLPKSMCIANAWRTEDLGIVSSTKKRLDKIVKDLKLGRNFTRVFIMLAPYGWALHEEITRRAK